MQVFSLEQIQERANKQRASESDLYSYLSSSEPRLPALVAATPTVYDVFRLITTLSHALSVEEVLHTSVRMITQIIDTGLCLILLREPLHHDQFQLEACVPVLLDNEVERHPLTIANALLERLRDAMQQGRILQLSPQEQDALNPLNNVEYAELRAVPLLLGDTCLGMLLCYSSTLLSVLEENQLLLCTLARQMALAIEHCQQSERQQREQRQRQIQIFMHDLFHPASRYTEAAMQKRACILGWNLTAPHLVVSMLLLPVVEESMVTEDERLAHLRSASTQVWKSLHERYPGSLTGGDDEQLLCLLRLEMESVVDSVNRECDKLAQHLYAEQHIRLFTGISAPCCTVAAYQHGYIQAQEALQVVQWLKQRGGSASFNTLGVYRDLYRFAHENVLSDHYQAQIAALADYDRCRHTNLLDTLETYLECGTNIAETTEQLRIHRNTTLQRLERIQSLCTLDLKQRANWLPLLIALKLHRLTSPGEQAP